MLTTPSAINTDRKAPNSSAHLATSEEVRKIRLSGRPTEAVELSRRVLLTDSNDYRLHDELGMALVELDRQEEAIGAFMHAFHLKPDFDEACNKIGSAFASRGLLEPAAYWFLRARQMNPEATNYLYHYGCVLLMLNSFEEAHKVFDQWLRSDPKNPIVRHLVSAAIGSPSISRASADYIRALFDNFADHFDDQLAKLNYCGPDLVVRALSQVIEVPSTGWNILDAGCGTGLVGVALKPLASRLVGVDLSVSMLNISRQRAVYDELIQADIFDYFRRHCQEFDVISAADVLTYVGDLNGFFKQAAMSLLPGGLVVVAVEALKTGGDYHLNLTGRFSHSRDYLQHVIERAGFAVARLWEDAMRYEVKKPVATWVAVGLLPDI